MKDQIVISELTQVDAPTGSRGKWWPDLFLEKNGELQPITPEQCRQLAAELRRRKKSNEFAVHDESGEAIGHVTKCGRIFLWDIESDVEIVIEEGA